MPTVGRNEPCPCGSSRKYKQCCLPKERASQAREVGLARVDELLWARLLAYGQRPALMSDTVSALSRFWNRDLDLTAAQEMGREELLLFLEWYTHDYQTSKDRQTIAGLFAADEGPRLVPEQRALLAERQASHLSLFGVEEVVSGGRLRVGDLLAGGSCEVEDAGLARLAMPGDLLLGRRLGDSMAGRLSRGTVLLPGTLGPGLVAATKRAFGHYRDEHYQATWAEFLREMGYVLLHYLISPEAEDAYQRAPRREGYFDPRPAAERMRAAMRRRAEEQAREQAAPAEGQGPRASAPLVERTAGGILIPGQAKPASEGQGGILLPGQARL